NTSGNKHVVVSNLLSLNNNLKNEPIVTIIPNPSNGIFKISSTTNVAAQLNIFDLVGKVIFTKKLSNLNSQEIDISDFPAGVYECKIFGEQLYKVIKLVKY
ncbi:MAG TPA: T9SS type A sorting domain-containing protein, partial [Bacteroidia bacterium]|nr:T9SS type A sorting domain-containing protein [Bacteroidia bacterium]